MDNAAGISFQNRMNLDSKLKGMIDLRWNWVIELQDADQTRAVKVHTAHNVADVLTKCLSRNTYEHIQTIPCSVAQQLIQQEKQRSSEVHLGGTLPSSSTMPKTAVIN